MTKDVMVTDNEEPVDELSEDMIVVTPGQMLMDARKKAGLSVEQVANQLNFRIKLVDDIEDNTFDHKLPATYNRGYLRAYAKLVSIDVDEVLAAYDLLDVAEAQRSEMQSFSNLTEKQAEHSRFMWLSYLIIAILIGLMVLWWLQSPKNSSLIDDVVTLPENKVTEEQVDLATQNTQPSINDENHLPDSRQDMKDNIESATDTHQSPESIATSQSEQKIVVPEANKELTIKTSEPVDETTLVAEKSIAVFTFSGDCWVNIYDATGERIAWGVKKSGYVMTVSGKPPFQVTLGKPELASIDYNGKAVDMTPFNVGNIAKFSLPLSQ